MNLAWARTVCPASAVMTCPARRIVLVQVRAAAARTPGPRSSSGRSAARRAPVPAPWVAAASRYGMSPSVARRAAHRLAVHRDRGQPARPGHRKGDRAGVRAAGQVRPGMISQRPARRARSNTRTTVSGCGATRTPSASRLAPAAASTSCRRGVHPRGHVLQLRVPAQHRRRCTAPARRTASAGPRAGPAGPGPPRSIQPGPRQTPRSARRRGRPAQPALRRRQR